MRILAICKEDPACILGGMGVHVRELYRAMARIPGVEIDLLTSGPGEGCSDYQGYRKHQSSKLVCCKPMAPDMSSYLLDDIQMARTLTQMLASGQRWDVVHGHEWGSVQLGRMARDALGVPLVNTMHLCITRLMQTAGCPTDSEQPINPAMVYLWGQEGHLVCDPDEMILCSRAYVRIVREVFLAKRHIHMIYNGIDSDTWHPKAGDGYRAKTLHGLPHRPIALFVGRIADMKGIRPILDVVEYQDPGCCIVLCGEVNANTPAERDAWDVTQRILDLRERFPDRLRWVGFRTGQELHDMYAAADVGLMPSLHEPFGIVALEMMASGVPLIATEVDGLGEVVKNDAGQEFALIIRPNEQHDIREALTMLMGDAEARRDLSALGRKRAKGFSWGCAAKQTLAVYRQAIGGHLNASITHDSQGVDRPGTVQDCTSGHPK